MLRQALDALLDALLEVAEPTERGGRELAPQARLKLVVT